MRWWSLDLEVVLGSKCQELLDIRWTWWWEGKRLGSGVVVLGTIINSRPQLVVSVTPDLMKQGYHAGELARELAINGGGGGRAELAQVGRRDPQGLSMALARVGELLGSKVS